MADSQEILKKGKEISIDRLERGVNYSKMQNIRNISLGQKTL